MKILKSKKQRELMCRILAMQKITDDLMFNRVDHSKFQAKAWLDTFDKIAENITELTSEIAGLGGLLALQKSCERTEKQLLESKPVTKEEIIPIIHGKEELSIHDEIVIRKVIDFLKEYCFDKELDKWYREKRFDDNFVGTEDLSTNEIIERLKGVI